MLTRDFDVPQPDAWRQVAQQLAAWIRPGQWAALDGPLGAGKTTFVKHLVQWLQGEAALPVEVTSPTFSLYHDYATTPPIRHYDLYRVGANLSTDATEVLAGLDWQPQQWHDTFVLVEWSDRLPPTVLPPLWTLSIRPMTDGLGRQARWRLTRDS